MADTIQKSKYQIESFDNGFVIKADERNPVTVLAKDSVFEIQGQYRSIFFEAGLGNEIQSQTKQVPIISFSSALYFIVNGLMSSWKPRAKTKWKGATQWAIANTRSALKRRVYAECARLIRNTDPGVIKAQKRMYSVAPVEFSELVESKIIDYVFAHEHLTADFFRFRAFISAMIFVLEKCYSDYSGIENQLKKLHNWQCIFSGNGKRYSALNKTLSSLPGGISAKTLPSLYLLRLNRPLYERSEIVLHLCFITRYANEEDLNSIDFETIPNIKVIQNATPEQIKKSLNLLSQHLRQNLPFRGYRGMMRLVSFIKDFPDEHNGNLVGLTKKSIQWHRMVAERKLEEQLKAIRNSPTKIPPIKPPNDEHIRFLASVHEIIHEGSLMGHCVATYAEKARKGNCYLFHVEYQNESATIAVSPNGAVVQSYGPRNVKNTAAEYGRKVLSEWGRGIKPLRIIEPISIDQIINF